MKRQVCISIIFFLVIAVQACNERQNESVETNQSRPNVIFILTDDQGYGELSYHGNPILQTPNLDKLASESIRFTDYHATPMCTPTRGQLLTGLHAAKNGAINVNAGRSLLRPELKTMADYFSQSGYSTGIFGKWHLGNNYPYRPQDRGFDEALWFPSSHIGSLPDHWNNDYFNGTYRHNNEEKVYEGYCTDVFFKEAMTWMKDRKSKDKPFFAYLPTNTPHGPLWAPEEDIKAMEKAIDQSSLKDIDPTLREKLVSYLGMIRNIDINVGRLMKFLEEEELDENTILVFSTDNGSTFGSQYYNAGMRGRKREVWEGGHRVPLFIKHSTGNLGEPRDIPTLTQAQDLLPTLLDLCDIKSDTEEFDGKSLMPILLNQENDFGERMVVINYGRNPFNQNKPVEFSPAQMWKEGSAVLWKNWRYIYGRWKNTNSGYVMQDTIILNNLSTDPEQTINVLANNPEIAEAMKAYLDQWWNEVKDVANEIQPIYISNDSERPTMLTSADWIDVFMDSQTALRKGLPINSYWKLNIIESGQYQFELCRWPKESDLNLTDGAEPNKVTRATSIEGKALPIASAKLRIGESQKEKIVINTDTAATFIVDLKKGQYQLETWFYNSDNEPISGAYFVYVKIL